MGRTISGAGDEGQRERRLTVAQVRVSAGYAEVTFHETARIYRLLRANPEYDSALRDLRAAARARSPLRVRFDAPNGDVIDAVTT